MALSLLFKRQGKIGALTIEATLSESHSLTATATRFPIEDGSQVSDHIITDPEKVRIEGFISNTPLDGNYANHAQLAFESLYDMWKAKELVTVVTEYRVYQNMAITNVDIPRDNKSGQSIRFTVELTKIVKVNSSAANAELFNKDVFNQATPTQNLGIATPSEATPNQDVQAKVGLLEGRGDANQLIDYLKGLGGRFADGLGGWLEGDNIAARFIRGLTAP